MKDRVTVLRGVEAEEISPEELKDEPVGRLVLHALLLVLGALGCHEPRRKAPVREPRGKLARVVCAEHAVSRLKVGAEAVGIPNVVLETREGGTLAAREGHRAAWVGSRGARHLLRTESQRAERRHRVEAGAADGGRSGSSHRAGVGGQRERAGLGRCERWGGFELRLDLCAERREHVRH